MLVYDNYKISHSGITQYRVFEGFDRKMKKNSLKNLLNYKNNQLELYENEQNEKLTRNLDERQSKRLKRYCNKLCYYSATRVFASEKEDHGDFIRKYSNGISNVGQAWMGM